MLQMIGKCLRHGPLLPQQWLAQSVFPLLFGEELAAGELTFMQGRWVNVVIPELDLDISFSLSHGQKILLRYRQPGDASIRVSLRATREILLGKTDPDTLFFQRQLVISGDTDLAHHIKNMLDNKIWPPVSQVIPQLPSAFLRT